MKVSADPYAMHISRTKKKKKKRKEKKRKGGHWLVLVCALVSF
jgi:hypothetical protein